MSCERPDCKEDIMKMQDEDARAERKRKKAWKSNKKYVPGEY